MKTEIKFFFFVLLLILSENSFGKEVILIRHAEVNLEYKGLMFPGKASKLRKAYDTAPVHSFLADTVLSKISDRQTDTIYTSTLSRSISTAYLLFGDEVVYVSTPTFDEYQLKIVKLPLVMPYKGWTALSRFAWFIGVKRENTENIDIAKKRTKYAVDYIETKSRNNEQIILVTHGFINRNITKELKKRGWHIVQNEGRKNLGATILRK